MDAEDKISHQFDVPSIRSWMRFHL